MRITDSGNIIEKKNFFHYCFDKVNGIPLDEIMSLSKGRQCSLERQFNVSSVVFIGSRVTHVMRNVKNVVMYLYHDMSSYGDASARCERDRCTKHIITNVEYSMDKDMKNIMIMGDLPDNVFMKDIVVGDLRVMNYDHFFVNCIDIEHFYKNVP